MSKKSDSKVTSTTRLIPSIKTDENTSQLSFDVVTDMYVTKEGSNHVDRNTFKGKIEYYFRFHERPTTWLTEVRAGLVTFITMSYIMSVNANILADSGGPCIENGFDPNDPESGYNECIDTVKLDLITATALSSFIATFLMGLLANIPLALAPGMGINAYFAYNVVGFQGSGNINYSTALCAVFIEGIIFLFLSITGLRIYIAKLIPNNIKYSITVGIGLYLAHIGLQSSNGIGLITGDPATLVTLGGCGYYKEVDKTCETQLNGATTWIGIAGFLVIAYLTIRDIKG